GDMSAIGRPRRSISAARFLRCLNPLPSTRFEIKNPEPLFSQTAAVEEDTAAVRRYRGIPIAHLSAGTQFLFRTRGTAAARCQRQPRQVERFLNLGREDPPAIRRDRE